MMKKYAKQMANYGWWAAFINLLILTSEVIIVFSDDQLLNLYVG